MVSDARLTVKNADPTLTVSNNQTGWWQALNLRTKSTIISIAAIIIPVVAISGFTYVYVGQSITNSTKAAKASRANGMGYRMSYFMRDRYGDIQVLSQLQFLTNLKVRQSVPTKEQSAILDGYVKAYGVYNSIAYFDLNGDLIAQSQGDPLLNHKDRDYFQAVIKTNAPFISQPSISTSTKKVSIYVAAPIKDVNTGKTIAIIRTRISADTVENIIKDFSIGGEQYNLSDANSKFFVSLEKQRVERELKKDIPGLSELTATGEVGAVRTNDLFSNKDEFIGYSPLPKLEGLPDLKWASIIITDADIAFAPVQQLLLILTAATITIGTLAALLATVITRRATKPILDATEAVSKLGKGQLDTRLVVEGQDEMSQLGGNINLMASQLQRFLELQTSEVQMSELRAQISRLAGDESLSELLIDYLARIRNFLACDRAVIYEFDAEFAGKITRESVDSGLTSAFDANLSDPCIPKTIIDNYKQGRTVATEDVINAGFAPKHLELMYKLQIKSNLVVPIRQGDNLYGLLIVHKCKAQHNWQEDEISYLRLEGEQLGLALGGIRLANEKQNAADQERRRSEQLQSSLISLLGDVEGAASGDLTVRAQITADDIGIVADFFNAIIESLRDVVSQVKLSAAQVNSSVGDNDVAIRQLSEEAIAQTNQITDTLQSVEEMTISIQQVAISAGQAANASQLAANTAEMGGVAMAKTVSSIMELRETVAETTKKVKRLGEASQQISKVVALIDQIALKTNMLAVNASIEAARAGEEGKGFAIVAEEVGALAAQSTSATKEIERIVESIQRETSEVVEAMESSTSQVVEGTKQVEEAKQSLGQILEASRQVNELFQSISIATTSQVNTSEVVKKLMAGVAAISQRSSFTSKEVSQALQETVEITKQLQESVGAFKVS